ncbi:MAG TPA: DeoR/GlpR family DNA-binding transcription regulator [Rariglobus sp.]|jgi:DeoR/GlpR family transcriptional regulator of sugar metabolism|nr:DeoR/GlpR family DNA-binding transcription regulator [Rariglobus sp.]
MTNKQRLDLIEKYIREHKYADLHTLAERFAISLSTVRRALDELENKGVLRRHHGGASLIETDELSKEYDFISRDQRQTDEKFAIARYIADQIQPGMTVILDGGTSTYAVARLLTTKRLQVITNSLPIAGLFSEIGSLETIVTGGNIYNRLGILIGPLCEYSFEQVHADISVLGGAGITEAGVWNQNALIVATQRKMIAASERTLFALDSSKFGRKAMSLTSPFNSRFTIVSDAKPSASISAAVKNADANFIVATSEK